MAQITVTGAAGFIGSTLTENLLKIGHNVKGIDSFTNYYSVKIKEKNIENCLKNPNFSLIREDLETVNLSEIFQNSEYIFHLAAQPGVRKSWGKDFDIYNQNNIVITQKILE